MVDIDRAAIIRELDKHAEEAARAVGAMRLKFAALMERDDDAMPAADVLAADSALLDADRAMPELRRVFAKWARLLNGPAPELALRPVAEPGRYRLVAVTGSGDLNVGEAVVTSPWDGDGASWRISRTDLDGTAKGSMTGYYGLGVAGLLEEVNRHLDEHGPWWSAAGEGDGR